NAEASNPGHCVPDVAPAPAARPGTTTLMKKRSDGCVFESSSCGFANEALTSKERNDLKFHGRLRATSRIRRVRFGSAAGYRVARLACVRRRDRSEPCAAS